MMHEEKSSSATLKNHLKKKNQDQMAMDSSLTLQAKSKRNEEIEKNEKKSIEKNLNLTIPRNRMQNANAI